MIEKLKKLKNFLGKKTVRMIFLSSVIGVFSFFVETSFVFILQLFLINLGLIQKQTTFLPEWLPSSATFGFWALILFGIAKGIAYGGKIYFGVKSNQVLVSRLRKHLLNIGLVMGGKVPAKELTTAFSELTTQAGLVAQYSSQMIVAGVSSTLFFLYGTSLAPKEMILGCILLVLIGLPFKSLSKRINSSGKQLVSNFTSLNNSLLIGLKNNFLIKLYGLGEKEAAIGSSYIERYEHSYLSYGKATALISSFPLLSGILIISVLTLVGTEYFGTPGIVLMTFFYVFIRFAQALSDIFRLSSFVRLNMESIRKLYKWFILEDQNIPTNFSSGEVSGESRLEILGKGLAFKYDEKLIFKDININLVFDDTLLIKGTSGSGKSTLLNVLLGLYAPSEGQLIYNNENGAPANLAELIAYVGPDPYIIPGTVRENLQYGLHEAKKDNDLWEALNNALLKDVIKDLPLGLDSYLSDTAELSTGQKQRLSMARALLRDPKILVLDEATSNLDEKTEKAIVDCVNELSKGKITIVVSHRDAFDSIANKKLQM